MLSSELFNKTVEENHYTLAKWFKPVTSPFAGVWGALTKSWQMSAGNSWLNAIAPTIAVLGLAALIYGVLEPGFGFNEKSLVMIVAGGVAIAARTLHQPASWDRWKLASKGAS